MGDVGEPALGGLGPFLGAGRVLARRAHGFERGARRFVRSCARNLAPGRLGGGGAAARAGPMASSAGRAARSAGGRGNSASVGWVAAALGLASADSICVIS